MPYISEDTRGRLDPAISKLEALVSVQSNEWAGELNYIITRLFRRVMLLVGQRYWIFAMMVGVLVTCALELYRRVIVPYEDEKRASHGDVYGVRKED